jgi:hypothetical protein
MKLNEAIETLLKKGKKIICPRCHYPIYMEDEKVYYKDSTGQFRSEKFSLKDMERDDRVEYHEESNLHKDRDEFCKARDIDPDLLDLFDRNGRKHDRYSAYRRLHYLAEEFRKHEKKNKNDKGFYNITTNDKAILVVEEDYKRPLWFTSYNTAVTFASIYQDWLYTARELY